MAELERPDGEQPKEGDARFFAYFPKDATYGLIVRYRTVRMNLTWSEEEIEGLSTRQRMEGLLEYLPEALDRVYRERVVKDSLSNLDQELDDFLNLGESEEEAENDE